MEHQETKFSFVYNEVKQRILNGQVLPGNSLPSSRMLCDQYHVSRYTVNRVFDALKKDGLIEIQPRLAPVVLDGEKMPGSEHILRDILKKREGLVQIYRTWTLILPPLLVFATQNCSLEMMPHSETGDARIAHWCRSRRLACVFCFRQGRIEDRRKPFALRPLFNI